MSAAARSLGALVLAAVVAACATETPPSQAEPSPSIDGIVFRYTCGQFPFGAELLANIPGVAERDGHPAAVALRAGLAGARPGMESLPHSGWLLAGLDDRSAEFVTPAAHGAMMYVTVMRGTEGWQIGGWGDCQPRLALDRGLGAADWRLDPDQPRPHRGTQVFEALVTELNCASGQPAAGRIAGPFVAGSPDAVFVAFAVRPLHGAQTCPSNPFTKVTVHLGEPLGDRLLLDAGRFPPADPAQPSP